MQVDVSRLCLIVVRNRKGALKNVSIASGRKLKIEDKARRTMLGDHDAWANLKGFRGSRHRVLVAFLVCVVVK